MPNHDHLVLDTPQANLSQAMGAGFGSPAANPWQEVRWREREGKRNAGSGEAARGPGERQAATNLGASATGWRTRAGSREGVWISRWKRGDAGGETTGSSSDPGQGSAAMNGGVESGLSSVKG
jgi:hypothetical protein